MARGILIVMVLVYPSLGRPQSTGTTGSGLDSGLVAYYPFDGDASDHSGNGNHGSVHGAHLTSDRFGKPRSAYLLERRGDFISVPTSSDFDFSDERAVTIAYWMRGPHPSGLADISVVLPGGYSGTGCSNFRLALSVIGSTMVSEASSSECYVTAAAPIGHSPSQWQFLACSMDDEFLTIFQNGRMAGRRSLYDTKWERTPSGELLIKPGDREELPARTLIDDLRIYCRALSEEEVRLLYDRGRVH